ncbi:MAG: hypothetical protein QOH99_338, partial [Frankiaceae bacterium]|nr:hypothetical protein [Frankiaceae bacterium]
MLKGDLHTTPLSTTLRDLAAEQATGCLHVIDMGGEEALVFLKAGLVYSVQVPGRRPSLGSRLVSSNALTPEALSEALDAQRNDLQGWRLGELLVHMGFVDQPVVEAFVTEQVRDAMSELIRWQAGRWRFRKAEKTREDVAPATELEELLQEVERRQQHWEELAGVVHGPGAVVMLSTRGAADPNIVLDADAWALLCKVDNERTIAELARECGFTLFEAGEVVFSLARACLVDVEEEFGNENAGAPAPAPVDLSRATRAVAAALSQDYAATPEAAAPTPAQAVDEDDEDTTPVAARLIGALGGRLPTRDVPIETVETVAGTEPDQATPAPEPDNSSYADFGAIARMVSEATNAPSEAYEPGAPLLPADLPASSMFARPDTSVRHDPDGEYDASIARVSAALSDFLGPQQTYDPFDIPARPSRKKAPEPEKPQLPPAEIARRERIRAAAAAELATAHAIAEAHKRGEDIDEAAEMAQHVAPVVDLDTVRRESERRSAEEAARAADDDARRAESAEAKRLEEEDAAKAADALAAERLTAEVEAWRQHELWLYAERLGAEDIAWDEHAQWLIEERGRDEETAWTQHANWLAELREAAQDAAWADHAQWLREARDAAEADAWEEHAAWLATARQEAEPAAWVDHAEWLDAAPGSPETTAGEDHSQWLDYARAEAE